MKRLNKLIINSGKKLNDPELSTLRGSLGIYHCFCYGGNMNMIEYGIMAATNNAECEQNCGEMGWSHTWNNINP